MNILQFTLPHHPSMGGIYTAHEDFRTALNAPIVEVVPSSLWHQTKGDYQIKLLSIGFLGKFNIPMNIPEILSNLSTLKVDIVIIHSLFHIHSLVAYWYAKQKGIPYLFVPHGTLDPYVFSYNKIQKKFPQQPRNRGGVGGGVCLCSALVRVESEEPVAVAVSIIVSEEQKDAPACPHK